MPTQKRLRADPEYRKCLESMATETLVACTDCEPVSGSKIDTVFEIDTEHLAGQLIGLREHAADAVGQVVKEMLGIGKEELFEVDLAELKRDVDAAVKRVVQEAQEAV